MGERMFIKSTTGFIVSAAIALPSTLAFASYDQAPVLDDAGLPPIEERLPASPLVLQAPEVGRYGGTWRSALKGPKDSGWIRRSAGYDPLVAYTLDWDGVKPNVAESWEVNDEATEYTFKLREGHKWSDGNPFTAEDVAFVVNDVINNAEYAGDRATHLLDASAEVIDETTVKIVLPEPNGLFLAQMANVYSNQLVHMQKAYCSRFHADFSDSAAADAEAAGFAGWGELLRSKCGVVDFINAERPTLYAWVQQDHYDGSNAAVRFERNPYYFKVDQEGNQLPYIDNLRMTMVEDADSVALMGVAGELDFTNRHIDTEVNKPVFLDGREAGGYHLYDTVPADMNSAVIQLNLNYEDDGFREIFQTRDFRVALSHAIDREEIIDAVFAGRGEPFQAAPRPESPYYHEILARQYTEYDPELANRMLDEIGLTERDAEGIRLLPDGRPLSIRMTVSSDMGSQLDIMDLVGWSWAEVGVDLDLRKGERGFVYELKDTNQHMAHVWLGGSGMADALLDPRFYTPTSRESAFALRWAENWYAPGSESKAELPAAVQDQLDLLRAAYATTSDEDRTAIFAKFLDASAEQFYTIGVSLPPLSYGVATNVMGNVPQNQPHSWIYPNPGPMNTSLLFKRR